MRVTQLIRKVILGEQSNLRTFELFLKSNLLKKVENLFKITVYPNTLLMLGNNFSIEGNGTLEVGNDLGRFPRGTNSSFRIGTNSKIILNGNFLLLSGHQIHIDDNATLELGSGYINHDSKVICKEYISIGHNTFIAEDVRIIDTDGHTLMNSIKTKPIIIGDNVWIGMRSTVLKGVRIGNGSVVAAGSLVLNDVPERCLVGGVPAKLLKENVEWKP